MSHSKYRIRYSRKNLTGSAIPCTCDVMGVSAISALNAFHREMQLTKELGDDKRNVLRPKLAPDEYSITSIALLYNSDNSGRARGEWIESAFDLPANARNPDVRPKPDNKEEAFMPFMAGCESGRLAE